MTLRFSPRISASLILTALIAPLPAADKINYNDHVLPIFRNACLNCHNPDKKKAGLDLSTYQGALAGSENGKVLQSGNAGGSLLIKCMRRGRPEDAAERRQAVGCATSP